jgi:hypothetical protein
MSPNILNKRAILLTGTIIPNSIYTNYNNSESRLQDYITAIKFYTLQFPSDDVYFIENSGFDLDTNPSFMNLRSECRFDVMRFPKSDKFNEGKGYQEFEMVDQAVNTLKDKYKSIVKITGRYIIENVAAITDFECKGLVIDLNRRQKYAQTYLMYFTTGFYTEHLSGAYKMVNDKEGVYIEHVVYKKIEEKDLFKFCSLFRKTPLTSGVSGSFGVSLKRNYFRVKVRNIERFFYNILRIPAFFY